MPPEQRNQQDSGPAIPAVDEGGNLDLVNRIIGHRLRQRDIRKLLERWSARDQDTFNDQLADTLRRTSALLEVSRRVSDSLSLKVLLPRMVELISEFLGADRCTIFLHDAGTAELYSIVAQGESMAEIRFPAHLGIAGSVFQSAESVIIPDAYADPRFNPEVDKKTGYKTRNILCAPIQDTRGTTIGVTQVLNKETGEFDADDLSLLESLTTQAASAFVNAQLHAEIARAREEEAQLLAVTTAISRELQLQPLLQRIMETVTTILNADRSTLFLHDPRTGELWSNVAQGLTTAEIRFPSHLGIAGSVFTTGKTINIPDAYADDRFNPEIDRKTGYKTDSILCMPVINKQDETIGVVQVLNRRGGPFLPVDEKRLAAFASQASIALENAQLFEEVTQVKNYNESILESMSNGVITVDADGNIVKGNHAALRLLGISDAPERMLGKTTGQFFRGQNAWIAEAMQKVQASGEPEVAMDADLYLGQLDVATKASAERRERPVSSDGHAILDDSSAVNLQLVPLHNAKEQTIGSMLIIEDITQEKRLKSTMARYMTKEIADKLLEEGEDALGGTTQTASVLFSDIRRFTSISEAIGATETVKLLNEYFSIMVDVILERGGILDKYIGDAIMAVFGAPFPSGEDADHAVQAGVDMLRALREFNARRVEAGQAPVEIGIGINTDEILSGNIGSQKRMDYTVIGDGVNLASRLEGANKPYGTQLLISELTVAALQGEYRLREVDRIRVKGKNEPVGLYEVLDHLDPQAVPGLQDMLGLYDQGLGRYRARDWAEARVCFEKALEIRPEDTVCELYRERCLHFETHSPPPDWDGVWTMKSK